MLRKALSPGLATQAMFIKVSANIVVQLVKRMHYHATAPATTTTPGSSSGTQPLTSIGPPPFDIRQMAEFALYGLVGSQVGNVIQFVLEDYFPTRSSSSRFAVPTTSSSLLGDPKEASLLPLPATMKTSSSRSHSPSKPASSSNPESSSKLLKDKPLTLPTDPLSPSALAPTRPPLTTSLSLSGPSTLSISSSLKLSLESSLAGISWLNILIKLILDQTIGLYISGSVFLICTNCTRVDSLGALNVLVQTHIGAVMRAGWHFWPLVAVCNFLWVPVRSRVLVAVVVGFGWSIFLSCFVNDWK